MTTSPTWPWASRPPCIEPRAFRDAAGAFATGVAFVTTVVAGEPVGLIVNSLASVSLEPPLVSFCPSRTSITWSRMRGAGRLGVNILARQHEAFVRRAAPAGADRFAGLHWRLVRGVPLVTDAIASLECAVEAEYRAGDHWIVVARVDALRTARDRDPLVFFAGAFHGLRSETGHSSSALCIMLRKELDQTDGDCAYVEAPIAARRRPDPPPPPSGGGGLRWAG